MKEWIESLNQDGKNTKLKPSNRQKERLTEGMFLLFSDNKNTGYSMCIAFKKWTNNISFDVPTREWVKRLSKPVNRVGERNERIEWCEQTNIASVQVAVPKRDCLVLKQGLTEGSTRRKTLHFQSFILSGKSVTFFSPTELKTLFGAREASTIDDLWHFDRGQSS